MTISLDNARRDGNARRACRTKIEFQEALTVKHPKTPKLVPQSLYSFPDSLLTLTLLSKTMLLALFRSSWKPLPIPALPTLACSSHWHRDILWSLNLQNRTLSLCPCTFVTLSDSWFLTTRLPTTLSPTSTCLTAQTPQQILWRCQYFSKREPPRLPYQRSRPHCRCLPTNGRRNKDIWWH